jgi:hypothetical protein
MGFFDWLEPQRRKKSKRPRRLPRYVLDGYVFQRPRGKRARAAGEWDTVMVSHRVVRRYGYDHVRLDGILYPRFADANGVIFAVGWSHVKRVVT